MSNFAVNETTELLAIYTDRKSVFADQVQPLRFMVDFSPSNLKVDDKSYRDAVERRFLNFLVAKNTFNFYANLLKNRPKLIF